MLLKEITQSRALMHAIARVGFAVLLCARHCALSRGIPNSFVHPPELNCMTIACRSAPRAGTANRQPCYAHCCLSGGHCGCMWGLVLPELITKGFL